MIHAITRITGTIARYGNTGPYISADMHQLPDQPGDGRHLRGSWRASREGPKGFLSRSPQAQLEDSPVM